MTDHDIHVVSGNIDPESCSECSALVDRLVKNAQRWIDKAGATV